MSPPEVAVFDLGKVLVDFDYRIAACRIAERSAITPEQLARFIATTPVLINYELGRLTSAEFFEQVRAVAGFRGDIEEFSLLFGDIFLTIEPMVQLHRELRERGYPTYIFSNTNDFAVRYIRRRFPFFSQFDGYVLSYEHGAMKPQAELYEVVERVTHRQGGQILFIDDRPENVAAGTARAWRGIVQETPAKTRAAIQQLGMLNHS